MRYVLAALALAGLVSPAAAGPADGGAPVTIAAVPVAVPPDTLHRALKPIGAWELRADAPEFGGFSALLVDGEALTAVTDRGVWLTANLMLDAEAALALADARMAPIRAGSGAPLTGSGEDAEGLTRQGGDLYLSFERDHRIARHLGGGQVGGAARPAAFDILEFNRGLEALATLPGGDLLAIAERPADGAHPMWRLRPDGTLLQSALPARGPHRPTGADLGPDGKLYLVTRVFSPLTGVSIRVLRYRLGADGWPDPALATELAAFESASKIDNMEGIALSQTSDGRVILWLISDDNFNIGQRTLLLGFEVVQ